MSIQVILPALHESVLSNPPPFTVAGTFVSFTLCLLQSRSPGRGRLIAVKVCILLSTSGDILPALDESVLSISQ